MQQHLDIGTVKGKAVLVIADVAHHFAGDDDLVGGGERLAAQPGIGVTVVGVAELDVVADESVKDGVRDLIADLVRMTFGNRLAGENIVLQRQSSPPTPQITLDSGQGGNAANVRLSL